MRDAEKLIGQNTRDQLLRIYTEKFNANFDYFSEQEKAEIQQYLDAKSGMLAGVIIEAKGLKFEKPVKSELIWSQNADRTESEAVLRLRTGVAQYRIKHTEAGKHEVRLAEIEKPAAIFNTGTLAQDYCQARANYLAESSGTIDKICGEGHFEMLFRQSKQNLVLKNKKEYLREVISSLESRVELSTPKILAELGQGEEK